MFVEKVRNSNTSESVHLMDVSVGISAPTVPTHPPNTAKNFSFVKKKGSEYESGMTEIVGTGDQWWAQTWWVKGPDSMLYISINQFS